MVVKRAQRECAAVWQLSQPSENKYFAGGKSTLFSFFHAAPCYWQKLTWTMNRLRSLVLLLVMCYHLRITFSLSYVLSLPVSSAR